MIVGIGVDIADISRVTAALRRTPALAARLFAESERDAPAASLAGCFAAKEAVAKALGRPLLAISGTEQRAADRLGVQAWHLSLSHDGGFCVAMVVAEAARQ